MGQIKLIHEHYDSKPWASIISATLLGVLAIIKLASEISERSWFSIVLFCIILLPSIVLAVMDIIWKIILVCRFVMNYVKHAQKIQQMKQIRNVQHAVKDLILIQITIVNVHLERKKRIKLVRNVVVNVALLN